jgi:hypothetical protein
MALWPTRQIEGWIQPALVLEFRLEMVLHLGWWRQHADFQHLRFQSHQHGSGQECFAAVGQIPFVTSAPTCDHGGDLSWHFDALTQLIQKAVYDGDHINIPGIEVPPLSSVLKQSDRQTGTGIGSSGRSNLGQQITIAG